jgi:phytoene dehydrogenase-like protein
VNVPFLIIGSGLSGLAAAIRYARFSPDVLILEKHSRIGGLNSFFYRNGNLIETGLHAITNYADPRDKRAPLNLLFRQLKLHRKQLDFHEQIQSEIFFSNRKSLLFSNNFELFYEEVLKKFPRSACGFKNLLAAIKSYDPFLPTDFKSAKKFLFEHLADRLLADMIICPLMYYGSSIENDMDLGQFVIMFRAIFLEGMFRPHGTMKDFLDLLLDHYQQLGGKIRLQSPVVKILHENDIILGVRLDNGEEIQSNMILSTIGYEETITLLDQETTNTFANRLGFFESIFQLPLSCRPKLPIDRTIIFYNTAEKFIYERPRDRVDLNSGVICFPANFQGLEPQGYFEIRTTHLANYFNWRSLQNDRAAYLAEKVKTARQSTETIEKIIGNFSSNVVYEDSFTPLTIERFVAKKEGAIYGSPQKLKNGKMGYKNLFLAGTDQGFLGIIGSMLSGISMVNQHILSKF